MSMPQTMSNPVRSLVEIATEERREREKRRSQELAELRSNDNSPEIRIRVWEKVHALRLPTSPSHPILTVIALSTRLSMAEVHQIQRERAGAVTG
jgi:hypothetical protein